MAEIFRHGILSNLSESISHVSGSDGRHDAVQAVLHGLKAMLKELESDPFYKDPEKRHEIEKIIALLVSTFLMSGETQKGETSQGENQQGETRKGEPGERVAEDLHFPTKEEHYRRNQFMSVDSLPKTPEEADKWGWDDGVAADCHQFSSEDKKNKKYVSPDGKSEVIFDSEGDMVTAPEDYGTYNFADPNTDPIGHFNKDVLPWIIWGNDETDTTNMTVRLKAFVIDGGLHAIRKKENQ